MMRLNTRAAVGCLSAAIALTLAGCPGGSNPPGNDAGTDDANVMRPDAFMGSATFTMTPATQNFGDVVVGQTSTASTFTVTNTGTAASSAVTVALSGGNSADFSIGASTCTGTLAPAATCTVSVTMAPPSTASPHSSTATLTASAGTATASSALTGRVVADVGFTVTPTPFSFGTTAVGTPTASHTFTVTNTGGVDSGTLAVSLGGLDATQFAIGTDSCDGMILAGGATCTIEVTYSPTSAGDHAGTLSVAASPGGTANASLTGRAQFPAALQLVPAARNFGSVVGGSVSTAVDFTLRNTGGVATANVAVAFGGADASEFSIVSDLCSGAPLAGGATCVITVQYTAGSPGAKVATITATAGTLTATSNLTATSLPPGAVTIMPNSHDFGRSTVGMATGGTTFTVTNTGGASIGPMIVGVAGANPTDFPIGSNTCSGAMLAAGGTCTVAVSFNPSAIGARDATLTANGAGASAGGTAALTGTGDTAPLIQVTPTAASFGSVATGVTLDLPFTVTNAGTAPTGAITAVVTGVAATQFSVVSVGTCSAPLAGGASCTVTVRFAPTMLGSFTAVLDVSSPVGGRDTSDLSATGISPAALIFDSGTPVTFGSVAETDTPTRTVVLRNTGAAMVTGLTATISGADAAAFTILPASTCGATLAGGSTCNLVIRMNAHAQRAYAAQLDVTGTPGGTLNAPISATGIADLLITCMPDLAFGGATIGGLSVARPCTILNQTTRALTLSALPTVSTGMGFSASFGGGTDCTATSMLAAGTGSCTMTVTFAPAGTAGARTGTISASATPGAAMDSVNLTGTALAPLRFISWDTGAGSQPTFPADFGNRAVGSSYDVTLTARNFATSGSTSAVQTSSMFTGDLNIISDSCTGNAIPNGTTCDVVVRFYPRTVAAATGSVTLTTAGANTSTVTVNGNGVTGPSISITGSGAFGNVIATRTVDRTYTITNASSTFPTATVFYGSGGTDYSIVTGAGGGTCAASGTFTLPTSGNCTVVVRFAPQPSDTTGVDITGVFAAAQGAQPVQVVNLTGRATSQLTLTPGTASFTTGAGTTSAAQTFTVTNVGATLIGSIVPQIGGGLGGEFPIVNSCGSSLASGASCTFTVAFAAGGSSRTGVEVQVANGTYFANTARVAVALVDGISRSQPSLSIRGVTAPNFSNRLYMGWVVEGANSDNYTFTVTNDGQLPTAALSVGVDDANCNSADIGFGITPSVSCMAAASFDVLNNTCTGTLAGGASCTFDVRFSPIVGSATPGSPNGTDQFGAVLVSAGATSTRAWMYGGSLVAANNITIAPTPTDFGSIPGGTTSSARNFLVANNLGTPVTIGAITINFFSTAYTYSVGTCTNGLVLMPGNTCTFTVTFAPPASGTAVTYNDYVRVTAGGTALGRAYAGVTGIGLAPAGLTLAPGPSYAYATTVAGRTTTRNFVVTNTGDVATAAPLALAITGADPSQFVLVPGSSTCPTGVFPAHATCNFDLNFAPTGAGARSATATISAGSLTASTALSGSAVAAPLLGISPSAPQTCPAHYAGTGTSYSCVTYTITNGGGAPAPVAATVTNDFAIDPSSTCIGATLATSGPSSTCSVIIQHTPTDVGTDSGTLTVSSPGIASVTGTISSSGISALTCTPAGSFGSAMVGNLAGMVTYNCVNQTAPSTGILTYTIGTPGSAGADFDVMSDTCTGNSLASGGSCSMTVRFIPSATGTRTATLTVAGDSSAKTAVISMSGTGT